MIHGVWRATGLGYPALCAEWRALPLADRSQDVVLGDGGFTTLPYPAGYRALAREIRRALRGDGLLLVRFSVRPDAPEPPAAVFDDLKQGRIGNFHAFKWRLAMAMQARPEEGVRLGDVYDAWHAAELAPEDIARQLSWPLPVILTIDAYRGVPARHTFPTLAETRAVMAAEFEEIACHFPAYELGERWPTLAFRQPLNFVYQTGPAAALSFAADIATQAEWLKRHEPDYLLTFPTNLQALIRHFSDRGERPARLREVRTISETVTPALRAACRDAWNVPIADTYSSQEFGYIAVQCPDSGLYHAMGESVLVEILAPDGRPCAAGEIGRLVITGLHNLAMPLIRYELRDYAEAGAPCSCGRGLPTINRILGRSRNMLTLPGGGQRWPLSGYSAYREIAPVRQYQLIQHTLEDIEARLVTDRPLTAAEEAGLARVIQSALGHPFRLSFTYLSGEIPRSAGGKFEEFVSLVAP